MFIKCLLLLFVLSFVEAEFSHYRSAPSCAVPRIKNGKVRPRQRGTFFRYSCFPRYTLVGNKYATCRYGKWDLPPPVCVKSGCPELEEVKNSVNMTSHGNAWVVFFCLPGHKLVGSSAIYCDGSQWNTTAPGCYDSTAVQTTECDFEQPDICGWKADELHDFDWRRLNKKTPSSFLQTGPSYDHTYGKNGSGYYMYIESTGRVENETARLLSPVYDAKLAKDGCFVFWYHMFGKSMGGLRVYQKPDRTSMYELLVLRRQNYTLFEQWGDQGNEWYSGVSMLSDVGDNFQIVIEGIRGESFMSDIAIDDVSIQHGENCSKAILQASTPPSVFQESCVGRCDPYAQATGYRGCSCSIVCIVTQNCCPDFLDVCDFDSRSTSEKLSYSTSSVAPPQTQKLIASTTEKWLLTNASTTTTSTSTTTTLTKRTALPTELTPITITTTKARNTKAPTTKAPTTKAPTTTSPTTKAPTTKAPTTKAPSTKALTTKAPTTKASTIVPPTPKARTTSTSTTNTATTTTATPRPPVKPLRTSTTNIAFKPIITRKATTLTIEVTPLASSTIFFVRTTKHDEKNVEKGVQDKVVAKKTEGMSGATVAVTVLLVGVALVGGLWVAYVMTRTRGIAALARLRGRTTSDPEVHYLKADVDDDE